jgi:hypothetical protein
MQQADFHTAMFPTPRSIIVVNRTSLIGVHIPGMDTMPTNHKKCQETCWQLLLLRNDLLIRSKTDNLLIGGDTDDPFIRVATDDLLVRGDTDDLVEINVCRNEASYLALLRCVIFS